MDYAKKHMPEVTIPQLLLQERHQARKEAGFRAHKAFPKALDLFLWVAGRSHLPQFRVSRIEGALE